MPQRDPQWEGLLARAKAEDAERLAKEKAERNARFEGKSAREISAMMRAEAGLDAKAKEDAAAEACRQRYGKSGIMGR
jgi:hypothetical protein